MAWEPRWLGSVFTYIPRQIFRHTYLKVLGPIIMACDPMAWNPIPECLGTHNYGL